MNRLLPAAALALLATPAFSQDPCEGNGVGNVYIEVSPAIIGQGFTIDLGSPDLPGGIGVLAYSNGYGPVAIPPFGTMCLNVLSSTFNALGVVLDGAGNVQLSSALPNDPSLFGLPPLFISSATLNGPVIELAKTTPLFFEHADSFRPTGLLAGARSMHQATALGADPRDNRIQVLVSGGGDGTIFDPQPLSTTEIFLPLDRAFAAGPAMSQPRAFHSATRLNDGRVLLAGGIEIGNTVTTTCDIYDHDTGLITPTGSMANPRAGHTATLLGDGRVLVTGGLSDYQDADTALANALNNVQDTAEVYNPTTGTWTSVSNVMSSKRSGHSALLEPDGRVLVLSGINGGIPTGVGTDVPTFTATCDYYDPTTNAFVAAPSIPIGRGFFGLSRLANGNVFVTGGLITAGPFGEALATSTCYTFDGSTWLQTGSLPIGVAFHSHASLEDGSALISGGYLGDFVTLVATSNSGVHNGTVYTAGAPVGTNVGLPTEQPSPRGAHTMTRLWDGSFLMIGGFHSPDTTTILVKDDAYIVTP